MDHGQESKSSLLETGTRIAQFIYFPSAFKDGTTFKGMVSTIDIAATILDFADIEPYEMDGVSWRGAIGNKQEEERWNENRCLAFEMSLARAARCGCLKYHMDTGLLYDLCDSDGHYITALSGQDSPEEMPISQESKAARLKNFLDCHLELTDPTLTPNYDDRQCDW